MKEGEVSFADSVRKELLAYLPSSKEEAEAELCGLFPCLSDAGNGVLFVRSDNAALPRKVFTLLEKAYNINGVISSGKCRIGGRGGYRVETVPGPEAYLAKLSAAPETLPDDVFCHAFLRGAFLVSGTVSDPAKAYRFEIVCGDEERAACVRRVLRTFGLEAKQAVRGDDRVVYLQDGKQAAEAVARTGASVSYLSFENTRIVRNVRGSVNRKVNCETSNLQKAARAGVRQLREIRFLEEAGALSGLPEHLQEIARVRREHPDATLAQIGEYLSPPIGRSGANHRLHELMNAAAAVRNKAVKEG